MNTHRRNVRYCTYCTLPLPTRYRGEQHSICQMETSTEPLMAPVHSCPDSGTYPCETCDPVTA